jgi:HPt (histidine-containing phosphotransfer) domain-containing protein
MDARLGQLRRVGGEKLVAELIELFFETAPRRIEAIRAGVEGGDPEGVARAAHSLTSSAGNLGAARMQDLSARLERHAMAGVAAALPDLLRQLQAAWAETRAALADRNPGARP